jgi:hypothetical protein
MGTANGRTVLLLFALAATTSLFAPATSRAQLGMDKDPFPKVGHDPDENLPRHWGDSTASRKASEPYGGQIFCPVSGRKLGVDQPAVPVQTTIGEEKPTGLSKLFHQKGKPGMVIYACCPACAEKIRNDPQTYLTQVITARSLFAFKYANAPDQMPAPPPRAEPGDPHLAALSLSAEPAPGSSPQRPER